MMICVIEMYTWPLPQSNIPFKSSHNTSTAEPTTRPRQTVGRIINLFSRKAIALHMYQSRLVAGLHDPRTLCVELYFSSACYSREKQKNNEISILRKMRHRR